VASRPTAPSGIEVEWQFDAIDLRPVERWLASIPSDSQPAGALDVVVSSKPTKRLVDTYMDTEDWRVSRSGYVLRMRRYGTTVEATLKDTSSANDGLRKRTEITEAISGEGMQALGSEGPVGRRVRALAGNRPLRQVLEVRTTRRPHELMVGEEAVAEVALDETVINAGEGQRPVRLRRVEVEVVPRWVDALGTLVDGLRDSCGLQPAALSKFEAGVLAGGLEIPGPPDLGPTRLPESPTVGDVAYVVLRRNLAAMLKHEPGTRLGEDPEELHDMRVATRRMRAALSLFSDSLPARARHVRDELGWIGRTLGAVRDLDVQLERLDELADALPEQEKGALDELAGLLEQEREEARGGLLSSLESARYERLVSSYSAMLLLGPSRRSVSARAPAAVVVPDLVVARHRSATKAARRAQRSGEAEDFHLLRIRCKRLRYALEFVSEIYEGRTAKMVRRVVRLQDLLGLMQDARVAAARLHELATTDETDLSRATVFVMGQVAERYRSEADVASRKLPAHLEDLKGSRWTKLKALMERKRFELGTLYGWPLQPPSAGPRPPQPPRQPAQQPSPLPTVPADQPTAQRAPPSAAPLASAAAQRDVHPAVQPSAAPAEDLARPTPQRPPQGAEVQRGTEMAPGREGPLPDVTGR